MIHFTTPSNNPVEKTGISRRNFIGTTASGLVASAVVGSTFLTAQENDHEKKSTPTEHKPIRWGFVGTGGIANSMARTLKRAPSGQLVASSSRTMEKAKAFASQHGAAKSFDSWEEMFAWDGIDAVYVATPTSVREEISIAAAKAGKHVLAEKPFASLESVQRIVKACQENNVAFMDGTHFSHHPRTIDLQRKLDELVGKSRRVNSVFQFNLSNPSNIRMQPKLEPMGAIGDAGWYNMRAIIDFLDADIKLNGVSTFIRREPKSGVVIGATGVVSFEDGSSSTWNCGFDAGAGRAEMSIDGKNGAIDIDGFISEDKDLSGSYRARTKEGGKQKSTDEVVRIEAELPSSAIMFEDFAAQVNDKTLRNQWQRKTERTQELLDAVWASALENEKS